jgi:hypothetical protein
MRRREERGERREERVQRREESADSVFRTEQVYVCMDVSCSSLCVRVCVCLCA